MKEPAKDLHAAHRSDQIGYEAEPEVYIPPEPYNEDRRFTALEQAVAFSVKNPGSMTGEDVVKVARVFEAYLRGEEPEVMQAASPARAFIFGDDGTTEQV